MRVSYYESFRLSYLLICSDSPHAGSLMRKCVWKLFIWRSRNSRDVTGRHITCSSDQKPTSHIAVSDQLAQPDRTRLPPNLSFSKRRPAACALGACQELGHVLVVNRRFAQCVGVDCPPFRSPV